MTELVKRKIRYLAILLVATFSHCSENNDPSPATTIYLAGGISDDVSGFPFWINGQLKYLNNKISDTLVVSGHIHTIVVENGNTYAAGHAYRSGSYLADLIYWRNDQPNLIKIGNVDPFQMSMAVHNDDVYIVHEPTTGKYWKNGVEVNLPVSGSSINYATDIAVSSPQWRDTIKSDIVHVIGYSVENNKRIGKYWKNGILTDLGEGCIPVIIEVGVSGNVFIAGRCSDSIVLWKNGNKTFLTGNAVFHSIISLIIQGDNEDTFVFGYEYPPNSEPAKFKYWKNYDDPVLLNHDDNSQVNAVAMHGDVIYEAGYSKINDKNNTSVATSWKNGTPQYLTDGKTRAGINSIYILK